MQIYSISQWMLFFFIYSFIGWVWESCYVSIREKRPVNRGFVHGPFLPLYGFGAVVVLACTMEVREHTALIFFMGMAGATVLEYFTGAAMEKLFHVKYWDYSKQKLNIKGYICPLASLCWGCFSVLMVRVVHPPIETGVLMIPGGAAAGAACVLAGGTAVDFIVSFREALDMKHLLAQAEKSRMLIRRLQDKLRQTADGITDISKMISDRNAGEKFPGKSAYLEKIRSRRRALSDLLEELSLKVETVVKESLPSRLNDISPEKWKQELAEIKDSILKEFQKMNERSDKRYLRIAQMLRRNPTAASRKFKETLEELKNMINGKP